MRNFKSLAVILLGLALLLGVWGLKDHPEVMLKVQEVIRKPISYEERVARALESITRLRKPLKANAVEVDLSLLTPWKLGGLYTKYLGLPAGRIPSSAKVSFDDRMASMYREKVLFKKCKKADPEDCLGSSDTVLNHAPGLLQAYLSADKMKMNLTQYISIADGKVALAKQSINWNRLCASAAYRLNTEKCTLLRSIVSDLNGRDLVAYGMTELLSSADGELNVKYMDVILRNAGAQFLYFVPALGDGYASLGPYQFTFYALRNDAGATQGANVVSAFVEGKGEKIPGSVVLLSGHMHHTAAFYFAIHNLASMMSMLKPDELKTLKSVYRESRDEMVIIIACAHHAPAYTWTAVSSWLKAVEESKRPLKKTKKKTKPVVVNTDLESRFPPTADMNMYAKKTKANLLAVYEVK